MATSAQLNRWSGIVTGAARAPRLDVANLPRHRPGRLNNPRLALRKRASVPRERKQLLNGISARALGRIRKALVESGENLLPCNASNQTTATARRRCGPTDPGTPEAVGAGRPASLLQGRGTDGAHW